MVFTWLTVQDPVALNANLRSDQSESRIHQHCILDQKQSNIAKLFRSNLLFLNNKNDIILIKEPKHNMVLRADTYLHLHILLSLDRFVHMFDFQMC